MRVHLPKNGGMTMIENTFIDQFMSAASGDFVKIYLYLLRCAQSGRSDLSVPQIADALDYTEKDVKRALTYWQRVKRLDLGFDEDGHLKDVRVLSAGEEPQHTHTLQGDAFPAVPTNHTVLYDPAAHEISVSDSAKIKEFPAPKKTVSKDEIRRVLFIAERYFNRPLSQTESQTITYFMTDLNMDADLIDYLLDYCIELKHTSIHYMKKVALEWTQKGVRTPEQARREGAAYRKDVRTVFRALGISDHLPTEAEMEFINRWFGEYAFSEELISEACRRTILQIGKASLPYTDAILESWHEEHAVTLADVEALDRKHQEKIRHNQENTKKTLPAAGRFDNFSSAGDDWDELTRQVIDAQETNRRMQES